MGCVCVWLLLASLLLATAEVRTDRGMHEATESDRPREHPIQVITLDVNAHRYQSFKRHNVHLLPHVKWLDAVNGRHIRRSDAVALGVTTSELAYTSQHLDETTPLVSDGAIGVAMSHYRAWIRAAQQNVSTLVLEDDAFTHPRILEYAASHGAELDRADLTLCGLNQDALLIATDVSGQTQAALLEPAFPTPTFIAAAIAGVQNPSTHARAHRLSLAFGIQCYWVSPRGARRLLADVLPLRHEPLFQPFGQWPPTNMHHEGKSLAWAFAPFPMIQGVLQSQVDIRMNALYKDIQAYVLRPALSFTSNDKASSTVQGVQVHLDERGRARDKMSLSEARELLHDGGTPVPHMAIESPFSSTAPSVTPPEVIFYEEWDPSAWDAARLPAQHRVLIMSNQFELDALAVSRVHTANRQVWEGNSVVFLQTRRSNGDVFPTGHALQQGQLTRDESVLVSREHLTQALQLLSDKPQSQASLPQVLLLGMLATGKYGVVLLPDVVASSR
jgi:hypothetical protein